MMYNRVKILRVAKDLSRKKLADDIGVNFQTIGYLERGDYNPSLALAFTLAEYFNLPIELVFSPRPFQSIPDALQASLSSEM